ncbi:hypothetical protein NECAME_02285 [Necator americanus]|uniref:Uncharacterized protein n=1 Tax=Necator americanus TaxID=51031 RepID=W2TI92_NECAM|nr:hypothetical protein NECAME_02285 [Necator americanus]ETN80886.1 hypothetical protein NECAME_02285 [Necator americanus]
MQTPPATAARSQHISFPLAQSGMTTAEPLPERSASRVERRECGTTSTLPYRSTDQYRTQYDQPQTNSICSVHYPYV